MAALLTRIVGMSPAESRRGEQCLERIRPCVTSALRPGRRIAPARRDLRRAFRSGCRADHLGPCRAQVAAQSPVPMPREAPVTSAVLSVRVAVIDDSCCHVQLRLSFAACTEAGSCSARHSRSLVDASAQTRQHLARPALHEGRGAGASQCPDQVSPAHRTGQLPAQQRRMSAGSLWLRRPPDSRRQSAAFAAAWPPVP